MLVRIALACIAGLLWFVAWVLVPTQFTELPWPNWVWQMANLAALGAFCLGLAIHTQVLERKVRVALLVPPVYALWSLWGEVLPPQWDPYSVVALGAVVMMAAAGYMVAFAFAYQPAKTDSMKPEASLNFRSWIPDWVFGGEKEDNKPAVQAS